MKTILIVAPIAELNSRSLRLIRDIQGSLRRRKVILVNNVDIFALYDPLTPVVVPPFKRVIVSALARTLGINAPYVPPSYAYEEIIAYLTNSAHPIIALGTSTLNFVPSNIAVSLNPQSGKIQFSLGSANKNYLIIGNQRYLYVREKGDPTYAEYVRDVASNFLDGNSALFNADFIQIT